MKQRNDDDLLAVLLAESWRELDRVKDQKHVVQSAIPILYFGDSQRYSASALKVITVGLNPSVKEFPEPDKLLRFQVPAGAAHEGYLRGHLGHRYVLDSYFRCKPYENWFRSFEPILNGMCASFYDLHKNTALHTDLCSPIATSPTWSKLSRSQRSDLECEGVKLWHSLVETLLPDILLVSVAERYLSQIQFKASGARRVIWSRAQPAPYEVFATSVRVGQTRPTLLVFGRAAQTPFGKISNVNKAAMGTAVRAFRAVINDGAS